MTLMEVVRELDCDRLTPDGLKWIITHMTSDQPDRFRDAMAELNAHVIRFPETRTRLVQPINAGDRCCTDGLVCCCNIRTCKCTCAGCYCG